jgi:phage terminase small subunit
MKSFNSHATRWLGVWIDSHLSLKEHQNTMMSKAYRAEARVRSLRGKFGLSPENVRKIQVAAVQAVALYEVELWWDDDKESFPNLLVFKNWVIDNLDQSQEC